MNVLNRQNRSSRLAGILLLALLNCLPAQARMVLGIYPYLESQELKQRFQPLADYLSRHLGEQVVIRIGTDYESHISAIGGDLIDIAFMGPAGYVQMVDRYGRKPLLARLAIDSSPTCRGYIVVREDSPLLGLPDLKGRIFAFADPHSTMGRLVPEAMLLQAGVALGDLKAYKSYPGYNNVAMAVLAGDADAGALKDDEFRSFRDRGLRSLGVSQPVSSHLFVARSSMPEATLAEIRRLLLDLHGRTQVRDILRPIRRNLTSLAPVDDGDYDGLRRMMEVVAQ